eukprot:symbB.v1.2.012501.t1/scaffold862.1/size157115/10
MSTGGGYTPVKVGDIVSPNPNEGGPVRAGPTFNWASVLPVLVCLLIAALVATGALFMDQYQKLLGPSTAADDPMTSPPVFVQKPKPQVVAHIREYHYEEDEPPGGHFHIPVNHLRGQAHAYTEIEGGKPLRYNCLAIDASWQHEWSTDKKQWCCTHDNPKYCAESSIDCTSHPSTWTKSQKEWCEWHDKYEISDTKHQYYHGVHPFYAWPQHSIHHYADPHLNDRWYYGTGHDKPISVTRGTVAEVEKL